MSVDYATAAASTYHPELNEDILHSLLSQYRQVVLQSIVSSFGLDALLFDDQHGGDVDTVHNVRKIGDGPNHDPKMCYKNPKNQRAYESQGSYNKQVSDELHRTDAYIARNAEVSSAKKAGNLTDAYSGKRVARNAKVDLDHVISAKEIHDDRGRVLAGLSASDLASRSENLQPTDRSINRSMKDKDIDEYLVWLEKNRPARQKRIRELRDLPTLTSKQKGELHKLEKQEQVDAGAMRRADSKARTSYDSAINHSYYMSRGFWGDAAKAAAKSSGLMALRQAVGFVFVELWLCVEDEITPYIHGISGRQRGDFDAKGMLKAVGVGLKKGMSKALSDFGRLLEQMGQGAIAGALSSLSTTLANAFLTTSANVVTLIRQVYASLVQASEVLFINPECYAVGERLRAFCKIVAAGASVVSGTLVSQALQAQPISTFPIVGDAIPSVCGSLVSGIMSVTLLLYLDRSRLMNGLVGALDKLYTFDSEVAALRAWADGFERYAAQLEGIDYDELAREMSVYDGLMAKLNSDLSDEKLTEALIEANDELGFALPWEGDFDDFMGNAGNTLVFG